MVLLRVSGHSGAGKSRLLKEVEERGISLRRVVLYTTRSPRPGEVDGVDYHFVTPEHIQRLPVDTYYAGPVREMLQAVNLVTLEEDLKTGELVIIEIFHRLWPGLERTMRERLGDQLRTTSIFLCALELEALRSLEESEARRRIEGNVKTILRWRGTEDEVDIAKRSQSAANEVLAALTGAEQYDRIIRTSPEGPYGKDDWTCPEGPRGSAATAIREFTTLLETL